LIAKNIGCNFLNEIKNIYILYALRIQAAMEDRHAETYSLFANLLVGNEEEINRVRDSVVSMESVKMKLAWICEWTNEKKHNFATRIFAAELMEGLLFSSSFTGIDFFAKNARMPGLCQANSLIRIDENMHCLTNRDIYDELEYTRLSESRIIEMVRSVVEVESNFAIQSLKYTKKNKITGQMTEVDGFPGLNSQMMVQHIQYVADCIILQKIGMTLCVTLIALRL
jgi:ribonucleotide reductase beta subunit family protein with ferritin-like domain